MWCSTCANVVARGCHRCTSPDVVANRVQVQVPIPQVLVRAAALQQAWRAVRAVEHSEGGAGTRVPATTREDGRGHR